MNTVRPRCRIPTFPGAIIRRRFQSRKANLRVSFPGAFQSKMAISVTAPAQAAAAERTRKERGRERERERGLLFPPRNKIRKSGSHDFCQKRIIAGNVRSVPAILFLYLEKLSLRRPPKSVPNRNLPFFLHFPMDMLNMGVKPGYDAGTLLSGIGKMIQCARIASRYSRISLSILARPQHNLR